ncbi:unknown [Clostridium sp. CAG:448]|nr:unknown [Clostridium sp. CAG:448]
MHRRDNGGIGSEIAVIPDDDLGIVLHGQIEVPVKAFADLGVFSVMKRDRTLQKAPLAERAQHLVQNLRPLFGFVLVSAVVIQIQIVRAAFDCLQFRLCRIKQNPASDFLLFRAADFLLFSAADFLLSPAVFPFSVIPLFFGHDNIPRSLFPQANARLSFSDSRSAPRIPRRAVGRHKHTPFHRFLQDLSDDWRIFVPTIGEILFRRLANFRSDDWRTNKKPACPSCFRNGLRVFRL